MVTFISIYVWYAFTVHAYQMQFYIRAISVCHEFVVVVVAAVVEKGVVWLAYPFNMEATFE